MFSFFLWQNEIMRLLIKIFLFSILFLSVGLTSASQASWKKPNPVNKPFSYNSGLQAQTPCSEESIIQLQPTWMAAGKQFGVRWQILAAITKIESEYGCNMGPSSAGAIGWTQFLPSTWSDWGMDGDGDGKADPENSVDAIYSTARYLRVNGAPQDYRKAIFAYNHANWYVEKVLTTSKTFSKVSNPKKFAKAAKLSQYAQDLKNNIKASQQKFKQAKKEEQKKLRQVKQGQKDFKKAKKEIKQAKKVAKRSQHKLITATSEYINLSASIDTQDTDDNVLTYIASANSQDAVLIYQTAGNMLDQKNEDLKRLRMLSEQANLAQEKAYFLAKKQEELNRNKIVNLSEAQYNRSIREKALRRQKLDQKLYNKTVKTWEKNYAQLGNIEDTPFGINPNASFTTKMIFYARRELTKNVQEEPLGSNESPDIQRYRSIIATNPPPGPWCAYFISYLAHRSGYALGPDGGGFGAVDSMISYSKQENEFIEDVSQARPGDIIFFVQHVGLVEDVQGENITTIEGNASNKLLRRDKRQKGAIGLWRIPQQKVKSRISGD